MPTWLKMVLVWTLGPVLVALGLGFFLGGRSVKNAVKNGATVDADGKLVTPQKKAA